MILSDSSTKSVPAKRLLARPENTLACIFALIVGLILTTPWAVADGDEQISDDVQEVAPMRSLLAQVHETYPGHVLEVELEREQYGDGEILVYEIKLLTKKGRVLKLEYDAIDLKLLKMNGRLEN